MASSYTIQQLCIQAHFCMPAVTTQYILEVNAAQQKDKIFFV
jgi:hypothetical protein